MGLQHRLGTKVNLLEVFRSYGFILTDTKYGLVAILALFIYDYLLTVPEEASTAFLPYMLISC